MANYPLYALWATPRSTSTASEWMMRMRGDMACFHEPFGEAWYQGPEARAARPAPPGRRKQDLTFQAVIDRLQKAAETRAVFLKDMPHHCDHLWTDDFLNTFQHSFLIRDPAKVLTSLHKSYLKAGRTDSGFEAHEISFEPQRQLFDLLKARTGQAPVVIDSDDLLADPPSMVEAYCSAIGVPYIESALTWDPGCRAEVLWYDNDDSIWHESLKNSDGLKAQPRKDVDVSALPSGLQAFYPEFLEHYNALRQHRIQV